MLRNELPTIYSDKECKNRYGFVLAVESLLEDLNRSIVEVEQQKFLSTADGVYLLGLVTSLGYDVDNPTLYTVDLLRRVVPTVVKAPQTIKTTLYKSMSAFFTDTYTNTTITSHSTAPFNLRDKELVIESKELETIIFDKDAFDDIEKVSAREFCQYFNSISKHLTASTKILSTNQYTINLTAKELGDTPILVIGGSANAELLLGNVLIQSNPEIRITKGLSPETKIEWISSLPLFYKCSVGDYLTLKTDSLNGIFKIQYVGYDYIIINTVGDTINTEEQVDLLLIQRNETYTLGDNDLYVSVSEAEQVNTVRVTIPAIAPTLVRSLEGSFFVFRDSFDVDSVNYKNIHIEQEDMGDIQFSISSPFLDWEKIYSGTHLANILRSDEPIFPPTVFTDIVNNSVRLVDNILTISSMKPHKLFRGVEVKFDQPINGIDSFFVDSIKRDSFSIILNNSKIIVTADKLDSTEDNRLVLFVKTPDIHKFRINNSVIVRSGENSNGINRVAGKKMIITHIQQNRVFLKGSLPQTNKTVGTDVKVEIYEDIDFYPTQYKAVPNQKILSEIVVNVIPSKKSYYIYNDSILPRNISGILKTTALAGISVNLEIQTKQDFKPNGEIVIGYSKSKSEILSYGDVIKTSDGVILKIKPSTIPLFDHKKGVEVRLITRQESKENAPFIISTSDRSKESVRVIKQILAAGVHANVDVIYPRFVNSDFNIYE